MNTLKSIFTKERVNSLFEKHKDFFSKFNPKHFEFMKHSIDEFQKCRDLNLGKTVFTCKKCNISAYRPHTCKSRFCTSCGSLYAEKWALGIVNSLIDKPHRAALFTIPDILWNLFIHKREMINDLVNSINNILKPYYRYNKIINYGLIINIHTFSRDSSFNLHFHVILTEGGFNHKNKYIPLKFFPVDKIKNSWKYLVLNTLKKYFKNDKEVYQIISKLFKDKESSFFVNIEGVPLKNTVNAIKYFGRYLSRPAIAEHRIIDVSDEKVTYWYNDLKTKTQEFTEVEIFKFMGKLIQQIPPKNFKMVRRFGIYARRKTIDFKIFLLFFTSKKLNSKPLPWNERIKKYFGKDPLVCPRCNSEMVMTEFHSSKYGSSYYP